MATLRIFIGKSLLSLLCIVWLAGCNNADRIDASSNESFKASVARITKNLPPEESSEFRKALSMLAVKHLNLAALVGGKVSANELNNDALREALDGKTPAEAIKMGEEARIELQSKRAASQQAILQHRPSPLMPKPRQEPAPQPTAPAETPAPAPQS